MKKESRLVAEIRRRLTIDELRARLETLSPADLAAIDRLLARRRDVAAPGAERKYSDAELEMVRRDVKHEMDRLKADGMNRYGAKTAIRSLAIQALSTTRGATSIASNPRLVDRLVARWFKVWEAARKRG